MDGSLGEHPLRRPQSPSLRGIGLDLAFLADATDVAAEGQHIAQSGDASAIFAFKNSAWRGIFWVSLPPGILFVIGSLLLSESPRWLLKRGKSDAAYAALLRSRSTEQADLELKEMQDLASAETRKQASGAKVKDSLLRRKYVIPFVLACVILACNQTTGINSLIAYNTNILLQSGLSDFAAHLGYVLFTFVNFFVTFAGVVLVDRKGRKFLLSLGTAGIIFSMLSSPNSRASSLRSPIH